MNQTKEKKTRYLLWPALLLLLLLLAPGNIVRVQAASDQTAVQLKLSQGIRRYDYAYQVLDLVNQERAKKNRNPVTMDKNLLECAMTRAEELTVCASHTRPNGSICFSAFPYFENPSYGIMDRIFRTLHEHHEFQKCFCRNRLLLTERSSLLDPVLFFSRNRSLHTACQSDCVTCYFRASKADKYPFQRSFSDHIHRRTENTGYLYNL